jgi:uncharacterized protein
MLSSKLTRLLRERFELDWRGIHGVQHWTRVKEIGLRLAQKTGANPKVVELFAFLHDSQRECDDGDYDHGWRAGQLVYFLQEKGYISLTKEEEFDLIRACSYHTNGYIFDQSITVMTCWDADRLDLGRVGKVPDPLLLCTDAAKDPEMIGWAYAWSVGFKPKRSRDDNSNFSDNTI